MQFTDYKLSKKIYEKTGYTTGVWFYYGRNHELVETLPEDGKLGKNAIPAYTDTFLLGITGETELVDPSESKDDLFHVKGNGTEVTGRTLSEAIGKFTLTEM